MPSLLDSYVAVRPDTRNFDGELRKQLRSVDVDRVGRDMGNRLGGGITSGFSRVAAGLGGAFAALGVGKFFKGAVSGASDLAETQSKVGVIFGKSAADIQAFAKTADGALGQTRRQAMDAVSTFGTFGKSAGLQGGALTKFSTDFTRLASDMASFNNTSPEQAIEAIGAALRGETEPIRQYGVLLDDASLRQEALRLGLIKTTKDALTPQQKVLAAQALIYKQTGAAQGDFARTSGGLANQQRILSAKFSELRTNLGELLLPTVTKLVTAFNDRAFPALQGFIEGLKGQGPIHGFSGALNTLGLGLRAMVGSFKDGDVSSNGFVGQMERVGVALGVARDAARGFIGSFTGKGSTALDRFSGPTMNRIIDAGARARVAFDAVKESVSNAFATKGGSVDAAATFDKLGPALASIKDAAGGLGPVFKVTGEVFRVLADHIDTLVKYLPLLAGAFVAYKAAQVAANVAAFASLPIMAAQVAANFAAAGANRALATAIGQQTLIQNASVITTARGTFATIASTVAQLGAAAASKAWAAAQVVLNLALSANPIGLVIIGLVALGAALVLAYKNSETFRNIVQAAWQGIQAATSFAWENVIKPVFTALSGFITGTLAPVFTFLWQNVTKPAFAGISAAIEAFWSVAQVIFGAAKLYVENVLAPVFTFLWRNVIQPVFAGIGQTISFAWTNVIQPVLNALVGFVTQTVPGAFSRAVDAIGAAWDRVKEIAAVPIRFVVNTVIQKGIIENFNKIADAVGAGGSKIPSVAFAAGGFHEDHRAQIARGGPMRVWAEPETGGEAYIPLAPAKRARSLSIWEETGRRLGALERFAHGGFSDRGFGGVKPNVARAGHYFGQKYGIRSIGGVAARPGNPTSDHPRGLALDFMTSGENGTALANEAIRDANHFGVKYVIWRQRINSGSGWRQMADRGNPTANHMDHPHVSFTGASGGTGGFPGVFGGMLDFLGGLDPVEFIKNKVASLLGGMPGAGRFGDMAKAVPGKIISTIANKLRELPGNLLDTAGSVISRLNPFDGGGGGSVRDIVQRIAAGRGWGQGSQWADLQALIQRESSWNPRAQNPTSTAYGLFQFLNCVPLDTEILTRRGWLTYDQVRDGDETLGFNPETQRNEWTPILGVVVKPSEPVIKLSRSGWTARVTPGHRWWSERHTTVTDAVGPECPECGATSGKRGPFRSSRAVATHRAKAHGVVGAPDVHLVRVGEFVGSTQITKAHRLRVAAVADTDGNDAITVDEAAILAWVLGDGHIHRKNGTLTVSIYQSKVAQVAELELLLAEVPHTHYVRERNPRHLPAHTFYLHAAYARDLLTRSGLDELGPEAFVLSLNPKQRAAFLEAMYRAEGSPTPSGDGELRQISQNDGPVQDAIVLAAYLEGYRPTRRNLKRYDPKHGAGQMIGLARPWVGGTALQTTHLGEEPVWCVNTALGTWTMRQDDQVMLTGNSTWAGTGFAKTSDPAIQTQAGLKYIAGRYGTPSGALAFHRRNNYYDAGGVASGAGMMPKLTSAPERVLSPRQTEAFERLVAALDRGASAGRSAPLVGEIHTHDAAGLDLVLQQAQFRERAGHFG